VYICKDKNIVRVENRIEKLDFMKRNDEKKVYVTRFLTIETKSNFLKET